MERFDQLYLTIAQGAGGIEGLLNSFFSFMIRRTDFFYEADPGDKMGFPPGIAKKMLINIFENYQKEYYKKVPKKSIADYQKKLETIQNKMKQQKKNTENIVQKKKLPENSLKTQNKKIEKKIPVIQKKKPEKIPNPKNQKYNKISTYNGGETKNYRWSQAVRDLTVEFDLKNKTKGKELEVIIKPTYIKVYHKTDKEILAEGELYDRIRVDDSTWNIDNGKNLVLFLEKYEENIWKTIIKGDEEIDTSNVDNSKKIDEFDEETQGALRKVMYEQNRKQRGLPTTEEEKQNEFLKKAWNAEGSPFKGTPFDPSKLNIPGGQNYGPPN